MNNGLGHSLKIEIRLTFDIAGDVSVNYLFDELIKYSVHIFATTRMPISLKTKYKLSIKDVVDT